MENTPTIVVFLAIIFHKSAQTMNIINSPELLRTLFNALPSMVFIVDEDVKVYAFNQAAADVLPKEGNAILKHRGGEILQCVHSTETPKGCGYAPFCDGCVIRNSVKSAYVGDRVVRARTKMEVLKRGSKTEIYALISATAFQYDDKRLVLFVIEDISIIAELQKIIPICSYCHKIRDEKQTWARIEEYFKKNWDVNFSHGLCPECFIKEIEKIKNTEIAPV
ncbi:MAG: hypothetical protein WC799_07685 [Desulfobacteraceae bacterium]